MHEFAIAESIRDIALDEARRHGAISVGAITCRIGVMRQVVPAFLQTAFELVAEGTLLEPATLKLETEGIETDCAACHAVRTVNDVPFECPACGSAAVSCHGGQDITLLSMEIDTGVDDGDSRS
jgi:hydrogenase nickel incorporation protein HypA/HybF